jgi:hypothetical protein
VFTSAFSFGWEQEISSANTTKSTFFIDQGLAPEITGNLEF